MADMPNNQTPHRVRRPPRGRSRSPLSSSPAPSPTNNHLNVRPNAFPHEYDSNDELHQQHGGTGQLRPEPSRASLRTGFAATREAYSFDDESETEEPLTPAPIINTEYTETITVDNDVESYIDDASYERLI